jgi:hypothetical protein
LQASYPSTHLSLVSWLLSTINRVLGPVDSHLLESCRVATSSCCCHQPASNYYLWQQIQDSLFYETRPLITGKFLPPLLSHKSHKPGPTEKNALSPYINFSMHTSSALRSGPVWFFRHFWQNRDQTGLPKKEILKNRTRTAQNRTRPVQDRFLNK